MLCNEVKYFTASGVRAALVHDTGLVASAAGAWGRRLAAFAKHQKCGNC